MQNKSDDPTNCHEQPADGGAVACRRLTDVCRELGVAPRRGARWAQTHHGEHLAAKRRRPTGGSPEWWLSPEGVSALRQAIGMCEVQSLPAETQAPTHQATNRQVQGRLARIGQWLAAHLLRRGRGVR